MRLFLIALPVEDLGDDEAARLEAQIRRAVALELDFHGSDSGVVVTSVAIPRP